MLNGLTKTETARIDWKSNAPDVFAALAHVNKILSGSSIGCGLIHLLNLRVSQMNGCVFCVDMHAEELREAGETQARLDQLAVWRESMLFNERERAALHWAESLTQLHETHAPDEDYERVAKYFNDREVVDLTLAISMINVWNRFGVGFRRVPAQR